MGEQEKWSGMGHDEIGHALHLERDRGLGFNDFCLFNIVLLGRQVWHTNNNPFHPKGWGHTLLIIKIPFVIEFCPLNTFLTMTLSTGRELISRPLPRLVLALLSRCLLRALSGKLVMAC